MKIGIIGSGTMGISIGHFMSLKGNPTIIYDNSKKTLKQAEENSGVSSPVLIFKRNRSKTYAVLNVEDFIKLIK